MPGKHKLLVIFAIQQPNDGFHQIHQCSLTKLVLRFKMLILHAHPDL